MAKKQDKPQPAERPEHRERMLGAKVPEAMYREAQEKAEGEGRSLSGIIRSFLFGWLLGEYPTPPAEPGETTRAPKRSRKPKAPRPRGRGDDDD